MKYHITLAYNDVFGALTDLRSACFLDDCNEPCRVDAPVVAIFIIIYFESLCFHTFVLILR